MACSTLPGSRWLGPRRPPQIGRLTAAVAPDGLPVLRRAAHAGLVHVFAVGDRSPVASDGDDPGLTGPGSASWRVLGEPAAIAGGVRALLIQTLHPLAMAGVADHSDYRADPLGRLRRTSRYVTTVTFGTTDQALEVTRIVRRVHARVHGTAPDGRPYRADDPDLLTWVSCALTSSFLAADRLWSPTPVDTAAADRFVDEQSRLAALLDPRVDLSPFEHDEHARAALRDGRVELPLLEGLPRSVGDLETAMDDFARGFHVGGQARAAVRFLRRPPLDRPLRTAYRVVFAGAAASISRRDRRRLGLPDGRVSAAAGIAQTTALLTALRASAGRSPAARAARARIGDSGGAGPAHDGTADDLQRTSSSHTSPSAASP